MSAPALTPWFPISIKPARPGLYEIGIFEEAAVTPSLRLWTGVEWRQADGKDLSVIARIPGAMWRGLAAPAEGQS